MDISVGEQVLYRKVLNDKSTEEIVDIVSIDYETNSATIYIPSIKRERDTDLSRLNKVKKSMMIEIPSRPKPYVPDNIEYCKYNLKRGDPSGEIKNTKSLKEISMHSIIASSELYGYERHFNEIIKDYKTNLGGLTHNGIMYAIRELYTEIDVLHETIAVLVQNQNQLCKQIELLQSQQKTEQKTVQIKYAHEIEPIIAIPIE